MTCAAGGPDHGDAVTGEGIWDFVLVVNDYNNDVRRDINQLGRESGLLDESELDPNSPLRYRVRVRRWSEILESADQRLVYYKRGLQHNASLLDVKRYLREHRADVLPEGLFSEDDPNQAGVSSVRLELCSDWCQRLHTHRTVTRGCSVPELGGVPV